MWSTANNTNTLLGTLTILLLLTLISHIINSAKGSDNNVYKTIIKYPSYSSEHRFCCKSSTSSSQELEMCKKNFQGDVILKIARSPNTRADTHLLIGLVNCLDVAEFNVTSTNSIQVFNGHCVRVWENKNCNGERFKDLYPGYEASILEEDEQFQSIISISHCTEFSLSPYGYSAYGVSCKSPCTKRNGVFMCNTRFTNRYGTEARDFHVCSPRYGFDHLGRKCIDKCWPRGSRDGRCTTAGGKMGHCSVKSIELQVHNSRGQKCTTPCDKNGRGHKWCATRHPDHTDYDDYCSTSSDEDRYGRKCVTECAKYNGQRYTSCQTNSTSGYCSLSYAGKQESGILNSTTCHTPCLEPTRSYDWCSKNSVSFSSWDKCIPDSVAYVTRNCQCNYNLGNKPEIVCD